MMDDAPGGLLRKIITVLEAALIPHMVVGSWSAARPSLPTPTR